MLFAPAATVISCLLPAQIRADDGLLSASLASLHRWILRCSSSLLRASWGAVSWSWIAIGLCAAISADESGHWIKLFDGETMFGWRQTSAANWRIGDGVLSVDQGDPGFLMTQVEFADFQLQLEFRSQSRTNSGVFIRSAAEPTNPGSDCYEINIAPEDNPFPTGSLVARKKMEITEAYRPGWRTMKVSVSQDMIEIEIDGQPVGGYRDLNPRLRGFIGLQFNEGRVDFRNIQLRPLNLRPLFDGDGLNAWQQPVGEHVVLEIEQRALRLRGGPGQLESKAQFADFVLQAVARTNQPRANSGIFFRCIPGQLMNGYESQIHHGFYDDDRTRPTDGGTGAIFRRQDARRVVADDRQWFRKTIVATGDRFAVWVDGFPVTNWRDERLLNENPRQGKRLSAGTIILQAHDPAMDVSFRTIEIAEIPPE